MNIKKGLLMKVFRFFAVTALITAAFCCPSKAAVVPSQKGSAEALRIVTSRKSPGILTFSLPSLTGQKVQFIIYNELGAIVSSEEKAAANLQIDIKSLKADGMYTFTVISGSKKYSSKAFIML